MPGLLRNKILLILPLLLLPILASADETVYVWKTKGVNTYSDVPPTKGYGFGEVVDEDVLAAQKKATNQIDTTTTQGAIYQPQYSATQLEHNATTRNNNPTVNTVDEKNCAQARENLALAEKTLQGDVKASLTQIYQSSIDKYCQ